MNSHGRNGNNTLISLLPQSYNVNLHSKAFFQRKNESRVKLDFTIHDIIINTLPSLRAVAEVPGKLADNL